MRLCCAPDVAIDLVVVKLPAQVSAPISKACAGDAAKKKLKAKLDKASNTIIKKNLATKTLWGLIVC